MALKKVRVGRLATTGNLKGELGRLYRAARNGDLESSDAARLATILRTMGEMIRWTEIEVRLAEMEKRVAATGGRVISEQADDPRGKARIEERLQ